MILFSLGFVCGVWLLQFSPSLWFLGLAPVLICIFVAGTLAVSAYQLRNSQHFFCIAFKLLAVLSLAILLGFYYAATSAKIRLSDELPHAWEQKPIEIIGVIASLPEHTERAIRFNFVVEKILTVDAINHDVANSLPVIPTHISLMQYQAGFAFQPSRAELQAQAKPGKQQFHVGQRWRFTVKLKRPHGTYNPHGFDFESWAFSENMRATGTIKTDPSNQLLNNFVWRPAYIVERLREKTVNRISTVLAGRPYAAEISALVAGDDSAIKVDDWLVYLRTGVNHLMSISGLHITMLAGLAFNAVSFIWRRVERLSLALPARQAATIAGLVAALLYSLIAGFSIPTQRTLYMLAVFAAALWSGRNVGMAKVLAIALLVVVLLDPWSVNAPGFWLSFGAVAVISYALSGKIARPHWLMASIKTQWAVTIGLVPALILMFGQTSLISPVANAIAIPLISLLVVPLALLGSFLPLDFALYLAHAVFAFCMDILRWLAASPLAIWQQPAPPFWSILLSMLGVVWLLLPRGFPLRILGLTLFIPMLFVVPNRPQLGAMKVTVLDVGQGLAVVVQTKSHHLLYDTGPKYSAQSDSGSRIIMPFLRGEGITQLDGLMLSHDDLDHSGGLNSVLAQIPVAWLASSIPAAKKLGWTFNKKTFNKKPVNLMKCYAGQSWAWDGVSFSVLYPSLASYGAELSDNNRSCVLKITSTYGTILLTGDIEKAAESVLLETQFNALKSDVLLAPHHGSKTSSTPSFIAAVNPATTIFTVGYLNRFKHPKSEILTRYTSHASAIIRSDYAGAVQLDFASPRLINITQWRQAKHRIWQDEHE